MRSQVKLSNGGQWRLTPPTRALFWRYCVRAVNYATMRAAKKGVPCQLTAHDLDRLFVEQNWQCAISGIPFEDPGGATKPFAPSMDRIRPEAGYVVGNIRLVSNIVNVALNQWGEEPLRRLVTALREERSGYQ